jgi:hypothetical protein
VQSTTNLLLEKIEYTEETTRFGKWRRHLSPAGAYFAEFRSHGTWLGLPVVHYTRGICPETGRRVMAKGILAVGRVAAGVFVVGQAAFGVVALGQLGLGLLFGLGQAAAGMVAIGQLGLGVWFGIGQVATGSVAIGQLAWGHYVLAQLGFGEHLWTPETADPGAVAFFKSLADRIGNWWPSR